MMWKLISTELVEQHEVGAQGTSLAFVSQNDMFTLRKIQNITQNSLKNLNAELGIDVDFSHATATAPRNNRYRSNYQKREYGSSSGDGGLAVIETDFPVDEILDQEIVAMVMEEEEIEIMIVVYSYGRGRDRDNDSRYGHDNNDNGYHSRLNGITKPLGRRSNTKEYSDNF